MRRGLILLLLLLFQGCATIIDGTRQEVGFKSEPPGARVSIGQIYVGRTPCVVKLNRWKRGKLRFYKTGYQPVEAKFPAYINSTAALDVLWFLPGILPGIGALTIDIFTGAIHEFDDEFSVVLEPHPKGRGGIKRFSPMAPARAASAKAKRRAAPRIK